MLLRSVEALPEGLMVDPDCVRVGGVQGFVVVSVLLPPLSVKLAGRPALEAQFSARLGAIVFDQDCAKQGDASKTRMRENLFTVKPPHAEARATMQAARPVLKDIGSSCLYLAEKREQGRLAYGPVSGQVAILTASPIN